MYRPHVECLEGSAAGKKARDMLIRQLWSVAESKDAKRRLSGSEGPRQPCERRSAEASARALEDGELAQER